MNTSFYIPKSAMAIMAHPDDIEFTCVGTFARWVKYGAQISYVLCTSGEVGIAEPGMTKEKAGQIREQESRDAAKIAGVEKVTFLHEPDGLLEASLQLRIKLVREIRREKPEVIVCGDPTFLWGEDDYINHPDHRAAALAAIDATFPAAGQPNLFEELEAEGLTAHKPRKIFATNGSEGKYFVNIDETIEIKIAALRAHKSQMKDWDPEEMIKKWASDIAKGKEMLYAEAFRIVTLVDDDAWNKRQPTE